MKRKLFALAALALVKFKRFGGRTLMVAMINAPLVMPEVIIGLSLLLMLVSVLCFLILVYRLLTVRVQVVVECL